MTHPVCETPSSRNVLAAHPWWAAVSVVLLGVGLFLGGCGDEEDPPTAGFCTPTCALGYNCIGGTCIPIGGGNNDTDVDADAGGDNNGGMDADGGDNNGDPDADGGTNNGDMDTDTSVDMDADTSVDMDADTSVDMDADTSVDMDTDGGQQDADPDAVDDRCHSNADCPDQMICNAANGLCVGCVNNSDCGDRQVCNAQQTCEVDNSCQSNDHCPGLLVCDTASGACIESAVCVNDSDCVADRFCVAGECVIDPVECNTQGRDCPAGKFCIQGQCESFMCASGSDCVADRLCNTDRGTCVECLANSDCPGAQTCNLANFCEQPAGCTADADCQQGRVCTAGECVQPVCTDDRFEPNNSFDVAASLAAGTYPLNFCDNDEDWFSVSVGAGNGLVARVDYNPVAAQVELHLADANGAEIQRYLDFDGIGRVVLSIEQVEADTTYKMRIIDNRFSNGDYELTVLEVEGGFCTNDRLEPNDTAADAEEAVNLRPYETRVCGDESDWFRIAGQTGQVVTAQIQTIRGTVPSASLFVGSLTTPVLRDTTPQQQKTLTHTLTANGDVYLRVFGASASEKGTAIVTLSIQ